MKSLVKKVGVSLMFALPVLVSAQTGTLTGAASTIQGLINDIAGIVVALVFIYFLWGLMQYLLGDEKVKEAARSKMITSILIMFVLFSIWGIITLLQTTFGVDSNEAQTVDLPSVSQ
jgi:uncharacterized membrane protein YccC